MRFRRLAFVIFVVLFTGVTSNLITSDVTRVRYSESYPAAVCPPTDVKVSSQVSIATPKVLFRKILGKSTHLVPIKKTRYSITKDPILIDYSGITSIVWQSLAGTWAGASLCTAPSTGQWFVGGAADITSKGRIFLVNSGLSDALVDIAVWSEHGLKSGKTIAVKANSYTRVALDSIAAGSGRLVIRVTPRSGRVNAFLIDERNKGLHSLGGDFVNPTSSPNTDIVISGIPHQIIKGKAGAHLLRILAPGTSGATIRVDVISTDGVFAPVGLDGKDIAAGTVVDIPLNPKIPATNFSLRIRSDEPIVAGVLSGIVVASHRDLVWNSASPSLVPLGLAIKGLRPTIIFTGSSFSLKARIHFNNGDNQEVSIKGEDIKGWRVPSNATSLTFSDIKGKVYASGVIKSINGMASLALTPGSTLARAAIPSSDISVISQ